MKVSAMMTTPAVTVQKDASFAEIVDTLLTFDVGGVPVVDVSGHLVGVVTEADLVSKDAYGYRHRRPLSVIADHLRRHDAHLMRKASGHTAAELMSTSPEVASPDDEADDVARRMLEGHHKRLPVVDTAGHVVGIVARHDLLRPRHRPDTDITADIDRLLDDVFQVPERHEARALVTSGLVTLHGTAQWPSDVSIIEKVVGRVPGVIAVENHLGARLAEPRYTALT
jgi:CBS domain-containing protein